MHEDRRTQFLKLITDAKFKPEQAAFVTAFQSREHGAFKKTVASLAWGSFAWCLSEPDHLIAFDGMQPGAVKLLRDFLPPYCSKSFPPPRRGRKHSETRAAPHIKTIIRPTLTAAGHRRRTEIWS